jgi:hypothetical protein
MPERKLSMKHLRTIHQGLGSLMGMPESVGAGMVGANVGASDMLEDDRFGSLEDGLKVIDGTKALSPSRLNGLVIGKDMNNGDVKNSKKYVNAAKLRKQIKATRKCVVVSKNHPATAAGAGKCVNGLDLASATEKCNEHDTCNGFWLYDKGRVCFKATWDQNSMTRKISGGAFYSCDPLKQEKEDVIDATGPSKSNDDSTDDDNDATGCTSPTGCTIPRGNQWSTPVTKHSSHKASCRCVNADNSRGLSICNTGSGNNTMTFKQCTQQCASANMEIPSNDAGIKVAVGTGCGFDILEIWIRSPGGNGAATGPKITANPTRGAIFSSGTASQCSGNTKITTEAECKAAAEYNSKNNIDQNKGYGGRGSWSSDPPGCELTASNNKYWFNDYPTSTTKCSDKFKCICNPYPAKSKVYSTGPAAAPAKKTATSKKTSSKRRRRRLLEALAITRRKSLQHIEQGPKPKDFLSFKLNSAYLGGICGSEGYGAESLFKNVFMGKNNQFQFSCLDNKELCDCISKIGTSGKDVSITDSKYTFKLKGDGEICTYQILENKQQDGNDNQRRRRLLHQRNGGPAGKC